MSQLTESLKQQKLCPSCGVSWPEIEDSLNTPMSEPDWYEALLKIRNCDCCMSRFAREFGIKTGEKKRCL